jgi:hypothetical protein
VGPHASRPVADASGRQESLPIGPTFALFRGRLLRLVGRALDRCGGIHTGVYPWFSKELSAAGFAGAAPTLNSAGASLVPRLTVSNRIM